MIRILRGLLRLPGRWAVIGIFRFVAWYFSFQRLHQRVWLRGQEEDLGHGYSERHSILYDGFSNPVGLRLYVRMTNDHLRLLVVDLTAIKWDSAQRQWHFFRPGSPDPAPRIPRDG